jgi:HlyD family secretion protein
LIALAWLIDVQSKLFDRREPALHTTATGGPRSVFAQGRIEGGTEEIELRPRLQGRLDELSVQEGDLVREAEVLLRVDDQQYRHEVALAEAQVELAAAQLQRVVNGAREEERREAQAEYDARQAELERARLLWEREKKLFASGATTQQAYDDQTAAVDALAAMAAAAKARLDLLTAPARQDEVEMARARLAAAQAGLDLAKVQLDRTRLQAPLSARVLQVNVEPGELTGPDSAEPAIVLADTSRYRVRALVEELDAPRVAVGMPALITADGLPGKSFKGVVIRLSPRMTSKKIWSDDPTERFDTKVREVWIEMEREIGELVVGLRVDVVIDVTGAAPASDETQVTSSTAFDGGT